MHDPAPVDSGGNEVIVSVCVVVAVMVGVAQGEAAARVKTEARETMAANFILASAGDYLRGEWAGEWLWSAETERTLCRLYTATTRASTTPTSSCSPPLLLPSEKCSNGFQEPREEANKDLPRKAFTIENRTQDSAWRRLS